MDETRYFRERIPSDQHVPGARRRTARRRRRVREVYDAVDGARSVAEICRVVGQGEFEVTQALFQLVQSGHVVVHAPRPTGPAAIVALFNEAIALILARGRRHRPAAARCASSSRRSRRAPASTTPSSARPAPRADGTLDAERVIENVAVLVGPDQAESMLAQWLYEYVSFAMFVAEPYLRPRLRSAAGARPRRGLGRSRRRWPSSMAPLAPKS